MRLSRSLCLSTALVAALAVWVGSASAQNSNQIKRVLLISIDGMHAVDFLNCAHGISTTNNGQPKLAEHGGFAHDDTNVVLLLSNPTFHPKIVSAAVGTAQVAPTILKALGINLRALDAVRAEGTSVLPAVQF